MSQEETYTTPQSCSHCGNKASQKIVQEYSHLENGGGGEDEPPWKEGYIYELLLCPACHEISLRRYFWNDWYEPEPMYEQLYPPSHAMPEGLPPNISSAYVSALRVRTVDPNAYGVLMGRVLELVCVDRKARGSALGDQLGDLAKRGEIPEKLVHVAKGLKDLRNVAAHASLGELSRAQVPILDELARAILEYVYSAPALARRAEEHLSQLRAARGSSKPEQ